MKTWFTSDHHFGHANIIKYCNRPFHYVHEMNVAAPEQKYLEHRPVDKGGWLIHGHVHDRWKVSRKQINVSVEVWNFEPVSLETISDIIRQGPAVEDTNESMESSDGY